MEDSFKEEFVSEARDHIEKSNQCLLVLEKNCNEKESIDALFRSFHTLKGNAAAMGFDKFSALAHALEDLLSCVKENNSMLEDNNLINCLFEGCDTLASQLNQIESKNNDELDVKGILDKVHTLADKKKDAQKPTTIGSESKKVEIQKTEIASVKVEMKKLDRLMNLVGEIIVTNIRLQDVQKIRDDKELKTITLMFDRLVSNLQEEVRVIRMVPIGEIFSRFPRMMRDLSMKEGKKLNFVVEGSELEFDRTVLDQIGDPIVHLLRNSIDHGLETPAERAKMGKPEEGIVRLEARREKDRAVIEIFDDGRGIDPDLVKKSCISKGVITAEEADKLSHQELKMLIFRPGVSTKSEVTEISGRGVGMDVVMKKTKDLGGSVELNSEIGKGTKVTIRLPLTVAIISALLVKVSEHIYALPLSAIDEIVELKQSAIKTIEGNDVFILREVELPLIWLKDILCLKKKQENKSFTVIIVIRNGDRVGLVVDSIVGRHQILVKPLHQYLKRTKGFSGETIMGDGSVALIIDLETLL